MMMMMLIHDDPTTAAVAAIITYSSLYECVPIIIIIITKSEYSHTHTHAYSNRKWNSLNSFTWISMTIIHVSKLNEKTKKTKFLFLNFLSGRRRCCCCFNSISKFVWPMLDYSFIIIIIIINFQWKISF